MKNIAVVYGGFSGEKVISEKSAKTIFKNISLPNCNKFYLEIDKSYWEVKHNETSYPVNKSDFSFTLNGEKIQFDYAYIIIHGTPGEDGKLQGYLDMLSIPYSAPGVLPSALTFDKYFCNNYLREFGITVAESAILEKGEKVDVDEIISKVGLPCFVKPNDGGSSFGVTKVKAKDQLEDAITLATKHGSKAIIESFIYGTEVTCGVTDYKGKIKALPITEIVSKNEFFDYDAKYKGDSDEITPARISEEATEKVQAITERVYSILNLHGIARVDYIIQNDEPFLIEVNTIPGMSEESIIPQQADILGLSLEDLLNDIVQRKLR